MGTPPPRCKCDGATATATFAVGGEQVAPPLGWVGLGWVAASARKMARAAAVAGEEGEEWRRRWVAGMGGASVSDRVRGERDGGKEQRSAARHEGCGWASGVPSVG
jgi:hypothetical protein